MGVLSVSNLENIFSLKDKYTKDDPKNDKNAKKPSIEISLGPIRYSDDQNKRTLGLNIVELSLSGLRKINPKTISPVLSDNSRSDINNKITGFDDTYGHHDYPVDVEMPSYQAGQVYAAGQTFLSVLGFSWYSTRSITDYVTIQDQKVKTLDIPNCIGGSSGYEYRYYEVVSPDYASDKYSLFNIDLFRLKVGIPRNNYSIFAFLDLNYEEVSFERGLNILVGEERTYYGGEPFERNEIDASFISKFTMHSFKLAAGVGTEMNCTWKFIHINGMRLMVGAEYQHRYYTDLENVSLGNINDNLALYAQISMIGLGLSVPLKK
jgi:hypothetical protein